MDKIKFSILLEYLIKNSSYTIKRLAEETNIDRTVLQKYISGTRFPNSYTNIEKIADKLTLPKEQRDSLYNSYKIEKVGYHKYERLQLIKEIIENINYPKEISDYDFNILYSFNQINNFAFNNTDLIALIRFMLYQAKKSKSHKLKAYLPIKNEIYDIICNNLKSTTPLFMEMLIHISTAKSEQLNNIKQFKNLLPIIFLENTQIKYYYDNQAFIQNNTFSYPYLICCDQYSLLINSNLTSGILLENEINDYLSHQFDKIYSQAELFCKNISSPSDIINYYLEDSFIFQDSENNYSFSYEPCIVPALDQELIKKIYPGDNKNKEYVENFLNSDHKHILNHIKKGKNFFFYFTKSGLQSFYDTGKVSEIPNQFLNPFSKTDVIRILNRTINIANSYPTFRFYLIKEEKFSLPNKFSLTFNDIKNINITLGGKNEDSSVNLIILEPTLRNEFYSLIDLITLEECCYDFEYSYEYLKKFIKKHKWISPMLFYYALYYFHK